jgi:hypothetical protein
VPFDSSSVEYASHSTCIASPEANLSFHASDDTYQKMAQDVINMPHVKQYKMSVKRILHFISQMALESGTIFTVTLFPLPLCPPFLFYNLFSREEVHMGHN